MLNKVTLRKSLELAVMTERLGAVFYNTLAGRFQGDDEELHELFSILAKDEKAHEAQFAKLLEKAPEEESRADQDEKHQYLAALSISEFFKGEKGAFKKVNDIQSRDDALGMSFAFEKATLLYYRGIEDVYGSDKLLDEIIRAEKSHVVSVMKYLITGAKMRGLSDMW